MKKIYLEEKENGAIGIGAMIVFIALILVAAVASAVIIQTGEKLQQNAQQTGSDTQREMSGKIVINSMMVFSSTQYLLYFESSAGSSDITATNIDYQLACDNGGYQYISNDFTGAELADGSPVTIIEPGKPYKLILTPGECEPPDIEVATFWIHVKSGGSTYERLSIVDSTAGSIVV